MSYYNLNFKRLVLLLLPTFWRKPLLVSIGYAVIYPLSLIHADFMRFRADIKYRLSHNGQVCYLRALLNDNFDPENRRITVSDVDTNRENVFINRRETGLIKLIPRRETGRALFINRSGFVGSGGYDFLINMPFSLYQVTDILRFKAVVNNYKLASKRYNINPE